MQLAPMLAPERTWAWCQMRVPSPICAPSSTSAVGWIMLQYLDDAVRRVAIAEQRRWRRLRPRSLGRADNAVDVGACEDVPTGRQRLRPFRLRSQRNTGDSEEVRFSAHPPRVREYRPGVALEGEHLDVANGIADEEVAGSFDPGRRHRRTRAGVQRQHNRHVETPEG